MTYLGQKPIRQDPFSGDLDVAPIPDELGLDSGRRNLREHSPDNLSLLLQPPWVDRRRTALRCARRIVGFEEPSEDEIADEEARGDLGETKAGGGVGL